MAANQLGRRSLYVWAKINYAVPEHLMLIDTGADVCTLPRHLYDAIPEVDRPKLKPTNTQIKGAGGSPIQCLGTIILNLDIYHMTYRQMFHVCPADTMGILGMDFMYDYNVIPIASKSQLFIQDREVPVFDLKGTPMHHRVVLRRTVKLKPGQRTVIQGKIIGKGDLSGRTTLVEPVSSLYGKTGVLAAKVVCTTSSHSVPLELYNPGESDTILYKNTLIAILQDVHATQTWEAFNDATEAEVTEATINNVTATADGEPIVVPAHLEKMYCDNNTGLSREADAKFRALLKEYQDVFAEHNQDMGSTNLVRHHIDTGDERPVKHRPRRMPQSQFEESRKQVESLHATGRVRPSSSPWGSNVLLVKKKDGTWRMCIDYRELNTKTRNVDPYLLPRIDDTIDSLGRAKFFCTLDLIQGYHQVEMTEESKAKTAFIVPRMVPSHWEFNYMPFGVQGGPSTFQRLMDQLLTGLEHRVALAYLDDIIVFGPSALVCIEHLQLVFQRLREAGLKLKPKKCEFFRTEILYLGHVISGEGIKCDPAKIEAIKKWRPPRTPRQTKVFLGTVNYYNRFIKNFSHHAQPLFSLSRKHQGFDWTEKCQESFEKLKQALIEAPVMAYPQEEGLYVLDTDASGFAIGGVLAQMQENEEGVSEEKVIAYGSRTLHKSELRYCTRRRELLAIVHFVKAFRPYLYGRKVLIRTDHASLKYIKTLKDPSDQFMRWIERLEETEYTIEIRQGTKHCNADGLSRMPETEGACDGKRCICEGVQQLEANGVEQDDYKVMSPAFADESEDDDEVRVSAVAMNRLRKANAQQHKMTDTEVRVSMIQFEQLWTREEMKTEQQLDPDIQPLYQALQQGTGRPKWNEISGGSAALNAYWLEWKRLEFDDGLLCRRWESRDGEESHLQLILPFRYQELMSRQFHDVPSAAHMGRRRTFNQVHKRVFWYQMAEDVKLWIKTCEVCQRRKRPGRTPRAPQRIYAVGKINERVCMDICGPIVKTARGNTVILVITDQFSKYTRAFALPHQKAAVVADVFLKNWICIFGAPRQVHTDQGSNFESALFKQLCMAFEAEKTKTTGYHPQGDGQTERYNQTMMHMLNALTAQDRKDWDLQLDYACQAYNGTKHATTGYEPNQLMLGRQVEVPWDVMTPQVGKDPPTSAHVFIRRMRRQMRRNYQIAREKAGRAATMIKRYNDRLTNMRHYQVGDMVLLKNYRWVSGIKKMQDRYLGPYYVIDVISDLTLRIARNNRDTPIMVHFNRLKPFYPRTPGENTDNSWVYDKTRARPDAFYETTGVQATEPPAEGSDTEPVVEEVEIERPDYLRDNPEVVSQRKSLRLSAPDTEDTIELVRRRPGRPRKAVKITTACIGIQTM